MRNEYREMPYRRPRTKAEVKACSFARYLRFLRTYLLPYKWRLALCVLLVSLNACSVYLMAYYFRVAVDRILVVSAYEERAEDAPGTGSGVRPRDRIPLSDVRKTHGALSEAERFAQASPRPPGAAGKLMALFILCATTILTLNLAARLVENMRIGLSQRITRRLRDDVHKKIMSLSKSYHQAHSPGALMTRILSDVNVVQSEMLNAVVTASSHVIMFLVGAGLLLALEWRIALLTFCALIPYAFVIGRTRGRITSVAQEFRHTNTCLWGLVSQKLDRIKAIFAYARERHEQLNFRRLCSCFLRDMLRMQRLSADLSRATQLVSGTTTIAVFLFCSRLVIDGDMTLGKMMFVWTAAANLFTPVLGLTQMSLTITDLFVVIQRLIQIFDEPLEIKEAPGAVFFPTGLNYGISLRHVTFGYTRESEPALKDINLTIPSGQWVCIMGASGSGKTTLLHLLNRLHDPLSGDISFDGVPLRSIRFQSLRRHVALVTQEAQIFTGTIRDNITYGHHDAAPRQIMAAANAADCHDFIMELPVQYETIIGQKGVTLSGGQRQRIAIARALLTNPEVLLLDDCTSSLDADTEAKIQETLARLMAGKTAVIVSQRVSMAMRCHKVCVLEEGAVTEHGTPEQLLARGGFYARIFAQQTQ